MLLGTLLNDAFIFNSNIPLFTGRILIAGKGLIYQHKTLTQSKDCEFQKYIIAIILLNPVNCADLF